MNWRISSFTELEHMSEDERRRIIRACVGIHTIFHLVGRSILFGGIFGAAAGMTFIQFAGPGNPFIWILAAGLVPLAIGVVYQYHLIRIRGQLLIYLERASKNQRLPMCLRCGYNLEGLRSNTCPECGFPIQGKS